MANHTISTFAAALQKAVVDLRKEQVSERVDKAILQKLLPPEQRSWAIQYCSSNPDGWNVFIGAAEKDRAEQRDQYVSTIHRNLGLTAEQSAAVKAKLAAKV
jgi:hypothetical protein